MASNSISEILALEVAKARSSCPPSQDPRIDSTDGARESGLGPGANRKSTPVETGNSRVASDGTQISRIGPAAGGRNDQRWSTFVRSHAQAMVAWDFFISVTATFRIIYVFVAMEI
jgi:hypothetical protein